MDSFFYVNPNIFPIFPFSPANSNLTTRFNEIINLYAHGIDNIGDLTTIDVKMQTNEQILFIVISGAVSEKLVCVIFGIGSDNTINHNDIIKEGGIYLTGNQSTQTVTIHAGPWTRGLIFSYLPFSVKNK